jgi:hypothetical protein
MHLVPPLALFMAKSPLVSNFDVSSVKSLVFGAAPLGAGLTQELMDRLGVNVVQGKITWKKNQLFIPSPTKLQRDIVTLPSILPSFRNNLVNTLESTSFNGF